MTTTAPAIGSLKALIIDDQLMSRKQIDRALQSIGLTAVDQAETFDQALEKIEAGSYDVIFIDWYIPPGKSGYQLLQQLREERKYDATACVMVSAETGQRFISEAMKIGATAYLVKPVVELILKEEMNRVLNWLAQRRT